MLEDLASFSIPRSFLEEHKEFVEGVATLLMQMLKILAHNRARQRRKLSRVFDDWEPFQAQVCLVVISYDLKRRANLIANWKANELFTISLGAGFFGKSFRS